MKGIDYSWARPGGAAITAAGFDFVMRYVPYPGDGSKGLTVEEIADLRSNGLGIGLVFENTAGRALDGYAAGRADAQQYTRSMLALGYPVDLPCFFAIDFDAQPDQYEQIGDYFSGAIVVLGIKRVGAYGHDRILDFLWGNGLIKWAWQTYAWSGGRLYPYRNLLQYSNGETLNGGAVDYNEANGNGAGWLWEEDDMATNAEQAVQLEAYAKRLALIALLTDKGDNGYAATLEFYDSAKANGWVA